MIGSDAEVFLRDKLTGGVVSSIGKLGGSKSHPRPLSIGSIQEDNVLAEFNIPPAKTAEEFSSSIDTMLNALSDFVSPMGLTIDIKTSYWMPIQEIQHPSARRFGCDPDFNAYDRAPNDPPNAGDIALRTASGHVHIDLIRPNGHVYNRVWAVILCDYLLGMYDLMIDNDKDRRELYGKAGCYRPTPYGVEYRTMGNQWLKTDKDRKVVFTLANIISTLAPHEMQLITKTALSRTDVRRLINDSSIPSRNVLARRVLNETLGYIRTVSPMAKSLRNTAIELLADDAA